MVAEAVQTCQAGVVVEVVVVVVAEEEGEVVRLHFQQHRAVKSGFETFGRCLPSDHAWLQSAC